MPHHHRMTFYWDTDVGEFLFPGLNVTGLQALLLLSAVMVFLSILYEAIKVYQTRVRALAAREHVQNGSCGPVETATLLTTQRNSTHEVTFPKKFCSVLQQACVFLFQNTLGYVIMLSVMIYNGYVFLVIIFGMGLGYFLFGHISMRINMENIRARTTNVICSPKCPEDTPSTSTSRAVRAAYTNVLATDTSDSSSSSSDNRQISYVQHIDDQQNESNPNIIHSCRL